MKIKTHIGPFEPALGSPTWPWPDLRVFVLTSRPLPLNAPSGVVSAGTPEELLELMRGAGFERDVHLVGGQQTIQAFRGIGALDSLGVVILPILIGDGVRLTPAGCETESFHLASSRTSPDGSVELTYSRLPQGATQ
jgi:dihydrofolate reductase